MTKLFWLKAEFRVLMKFDTENLPNSNYNTKSVKKSSIILLARKCDKYKQHIELIENGKVSPNIYTIYNMLNTLNTELFCQNYSKEESKTNEKDKIPLDITIKTLPKSSPQMSNLLAKQILTPLNFKHHL